MEKSTIGTKLIKLRGKRSRKEVADACGISVSALSMYENDHRVPRDYIKARLAKYYNRSVGFIFFAKDEHK